MRRNPQLSREEYEFLRERLTLTKEIGITAGRGVTVHRGTEISEGVGLQGTSPNIGVITNLEAEEGRFLSEIENDRHMNVAFIGHDLEEQVFPWGQSHRTNHHRGRGARLKSSVCPKRRARSSASRRIIS